MAAHLVVVLHKNLRTRALQVNEVAKPCSAIKDEKEHPIKRGDSVCYQIEQNSISFLLFAHFFLDVRKSNLLLRSEIFQRQYNIRRSSSHPK